MKNVEAERRRFPRANFLCKVIVQAKAQEFTTHTKNISEGGVSVLLFEALELKSEVKVVIFASRIIEAQGRVIWALKMEQESEEPFFDVGIEFVNLEQDVRKFLRSLVDKLSRERQ